MKGETEKSEGSHPAATGEFAKKRRELASDTEAAFQAFSHKVCAEGALPVKVKQLVAVAVAHVTQCPYCIKGHTKAALRHGASEQELMETIWSPRKCGRAAPMPIPRSRLSK
jgi:AhpD family alkylhydroperoxidase